MERAVSVPRGAPPQRGLHLLGVPDDTIDVANASHVARASLVTRADGVVAFEEPVAQAANDFADVEDFVVDVE